MLVTEPAPFGVLFPAVGLGVLVGVVAQGSGGTGWTIFAVLVLSAAAVAVFQQTLP